MSRTNVQSGVVVTVIRGNTSEVTRCFEWGQPSPPLAVGSEGDWMVTAPGVVPIHFWLNFDGHRLHAKSADATASLQGAALDGSWNPVPEQAELRFGFALMRIGPQQARQPSAAGGWRGRSRRTWLQYLAVAMLGLSMVSIVLAALSRREAKSPASSAASAVSADLPAAATAPALAEPAVEVRVAGEPPAPPRVAPADEPAAPAVAANNLAEPSLPAPSAPRAYRQDIADRPVPRIGARPDQISEEWLAHHQRLLHAGNRGAAKVIFLGDSITEGWGASPAYREYFGKYSPLNLGLAGDLTQNVLWRIQDGALEGTKPQVVVVMVGINNLAGGFSPERTAGGVQAIVESVRTHLPAARVMLLSILPARQDPANPLRQRIQETNRLLANLAKPSCIDVQDFGSLLLEPDGTISKATLRDFVHPTPAGYERVSQALAPLLEAALKVAGN